MSCYNLCGIRSQHSNISKGGRRGGTDKKITGMLDSGIVKVNRNKYLTLNRCPLGNFEYNMLN